MSDWATLQAKLDEVEGHDEHDALRQLPEASDPLASLLGSETLTDFAAALGLTE